MGDPGLFSLCSYDMGGTWMVKLFRKFRFCWWICCSFICWHFWVCCQSNFQTSSQCQRNETQHPIYSSWFHFIMDWFELHLLILFIMLFEKKKGGLVLMEGPFTEPII